MRFSEVIHVNFNSFGCIFHHKPKLTDFLNQETQQRLTPDSTQQWTTSQITFFTGITFWSLQQQVLKSQIIPTTHQTTLQKLDKLFFFFFFCMTPSHSDCEVGVLRHCLFDSFVNQKDNSAPDWMLTTNCVMETTLKICKNSKNVWICPNARTQRS